MESRAEKRSAHADDQREANKAETVAESLEVGPVPEQNRRSDSDRRSSKDRRRSARGLFELRARRDGVVEDRRRMDRRGAGRFRLAFWRRSEG